MAAIENFNLDSLLDGTLDDLADMPEFKPFPAGAHSILATLIDKTAKKDHVNGHPAYELRMKLEEHLELVNPEEALQKGAETGILYMLDNEMGQGQFKKLLAAIAVKFPGLSNRETAAQVKDLAMAVVTKQRANKDKTQMYTDLVEAIVS